MTEQAVAPAYRSFLSLPIGKGENGSVQAKSVSNSVNAG